ncbi:hypothetical protein ABR737_00380 [Streptomyces sp. Edi2]|uniref:hypothetical protein n=1 Tax=Streptomyces sp. Edi2 TaxID=3162528 RepID=UPI003305C89D
MAQEEAHTPLLSPGFARRRFTLATWGSAAGYPLLTLGLSPVMMWLTGTDTDALTGAEGTAALIPLFGFVLYLARGAAHTVRSEQRELAGKARTLASAAQGDDRFEVETRAYHFGITLTAVSSAFNTRILPRRVAADFARRVLGEAKTDGLSPETLRVVQDLGRMEL